MHRGERIAQEGLVTEYEYVEFRGMSEHINFPVPGHFVMIEGKPETMQLADDYTRMLHPMTRVSLGQLVASSKEGKKKFPRPFIYRKTTANNIPLGDSLVSMGEKVLIFFMMGSIMQPVVWGAVESLAVISQKKFLRLDGYNLDRQVERYENDFYTYEFENDGKGLLVLDVLAKGPGTKQRFKIEPGKTSIIQYGNDGAEKQHIILDIEAGIKVMGQQDAKNEHTVYGETLQDKLNQIIDKFKETLTAIQAITVTAAGSPSSPPINATSFAGISTELDTIANALNEILVD